MSLNGTIVQLAAGDYRATLASAGATLCSLTHAGRDLIWPFDPTTGLGEGWQGRTLAPWPNRIAHARYSFDGSDYEVPCNEPRTGAALHGLASWTNWQAAVAASEVTFTLEAPGSLGYPFPLSLAATFRLDAERGLLAVVEAVNAGDSDAPVGLSTHPYLVAGAPLDECTFTLVSEHVLTTDEAQNPAGLAATAGGEFDFNVPTPMAGRSVDHAFTGLPETWAVALTDPAGDGVRLTSDAAWVQAFSSDGMGRRGVAVEPMTCPPNAFNTDPDLVRVPAGERLVLRYAITAI